jgi:hypothetical protein
MCFNVILFVLTNILNNLLPFTNPDVIHLQNLVFILQFNFSLMFLHHPYSPSNFVKSSNTISPEKH